MSETGRATLYRWDELVADEPMPLLSRKRVIGEKAMISRIFMRKGCTVPTHAHENEQFACLLSGRLKFGIGNEGGSSRKEIMVGAGEVLHLRSNVPHSAEALEDTVVLDVFSPPSEKTGVDGG